MDLMNQGVKSLTSNEYLLFILDKVLMYPFAFPLSSKQVDGVASQLLQLCLSFGIPNAIRADRGREFIPDVI